MRLARFRTGSQPPQFGFIEGDELLCLRAVPAGGLEHWIGRASDYLAIARRENNRIPLNMVQLLAPLRPRKFLGLGGNYSSHLKEVAHLGVKLPENQIWFAKQTSCVSGPFDDIVLPSQSNQVDYEGELAVVIGKECRNVNEDDAGEVIAGYMVANDVSVRDVQLRSPTMMLGKSFDTHGPIGPWLVSPDEVGAADHLRIRTWVNSELRQDGCTSEMRFSIAQQIAELTAVLTLEPGDVLLTGTPAGVGAGRIPPIYLQPGDVVRIEIEKIGVIANRCVAEDSRKPPSTQWETRA